MQITIFGDVHGNLIALEQLLKIEQARTDLFICHGDVVNYGPWSNECVALLDTLENIILLKGNHEINYLKGFYSGQNLVAQTFFNVDFPRFHQRKYIENYIDEYQVGDFRIQHTLNDAYIYPDTDLEHFHVKDNYIIGHSHYCFDRIIGNNRILNTGSLGQNRLFINESNYITYNLECKDVTIKSFTHDIDIVINEMKSKNYPQLCIEYYTKKNRK